MSDSPTAIKSWVNATCREVFHPRAQHCGPHFSHVFRAVFWQSIKLYTPFFVVVNLLNGRNIFKVENLRRLVKSVLRGSLFLSIDGPGTILLCCAARNLLGYHSQLAVTLACFIGCYLGISVEDPSRQRELTVYTSSVAADSVFRMLVSRGWAKPIPHGRALIFIAGMTISSWLHSRNRCTSGTHASSMKWIAGTRTTDVPQIIAPSVDKHIFKGLGLSKETLKNPKYAELFYVLSGFSRGFLAGAALRFVGMLLSRRFTAKAFKEKLMFSSFLSLLVGLYRTAVVCTSKPGEQQSTLSAALSGAVSGLSAFFSPSIELSMFAAAKTVDALIRVPPIDPQQQGAPRIGLRQRLSNKSTQLVKLTFAFACALVYYNVVFENHNVRPSYFKFLITTSAGHLRQMPAISKKMMVDLKIPNFTPNGAFD